MREKARERGSGGGKGGENSKNQFTNNHHTNNQHITKPAYKPKSDLNTHNTALTNNNFKLENKFKPEIYGYRTRPEITTNFFISNFPDNVTGRELWESLSRLWKIGEVCIPAKRDKFGRRFAFAGFVEVLNAQSLLKKI
jgi:hypothetical protein